MADFRVGVVHKGPHVPTTIYTPLDEVYSGGGSYRCILTTTSGILVTNTTYWVQVTALGATGTAGTAGNRGTQGAGGFSGTAGTSGTQGVNGTVTSISSAFDSTTGILTIG